MSQNIFNLYSATVFAEHPVALWNLDDDFSYVSLASASGFVSIINGSEHEQNQSPPSFPAETVGSANRNISIQSFVGHHTPWQMSN